VYFYCFLKFGVRSCLFLRCTRLITDVAQDGVFLEIVLRTLWTPQLHSNNVITLPLHLYAHYFRNDKAIPTN
jgi:hypothetical protein